MSWERIRGQDAARESFQTAYQAGRLGQAYLLVGPEGVGKRLFARELARALLCEKPGPALAACGACPGCAQVEVETHPDLHVLRTPPDKLELPVELMREYCEVLARKPVRVGRVVGIVEDADDFNAASANTFLKTLEEPPPGAILFLIGTSTDRQLPTVLSRCQIVRFQPLPVADVAAILAMNGVGDESRRNRLAHLARGSVSRALALNEDAVWEIRDVLVNGATAPRPNFGRLAEAWQQFVEDAGKESVDQRLRASVAIGFLLDALRQALRLAVGAQPADVDGEVATLKVFADRLGPDRLIELIDRCIEADSRIERRVQLVLIIESVLEQFTRPVPA